ncbi:MULTISPECIES: MBL fold metallo-hydrolase [unclassified Treponema]|uniref:MBL fold metallo-hydrolase n=1 Tax=unclassified Treponema TaxID=2638727 RepID=UPI0020A42B40|nr:MULTISPECIES: MBL fold metallo-hydrolase [unclassified Treponema]UTC65861.1 MBL fold metallo-hydrolase [Treponema sp. OMZ 789]UTC68589.1 MBL fold metallo-hydrolase [Treponema sp. OMZ 790]UTC71319.1 MBL fold metallo-hydrolase [Treponema sp. OMZ 791]
MKVYLHFSPQLFANTYLIGNEKTKEALIIDPAKITEKIIQQIEKNKFDLKAVLLTHNFESPYETGLNTILKIYSPKVYAGSCFSENITINTLRGDGTIDLAGYSVRYFAIPAQSSMFKIENLVFTGTSLSAGMIGQTTNVYAAKTLQDILKIKLMNLDDKLIIMPFYGPPTSVGIERKFNVSLFKDFESKSL